MDEHNIIDARFKCPFGLIASGPSQVGKTSFVFNLIQQADSLIDQPLDYIFWFYGEYNDTIRLIETVYKDKIQPVQGLPEDFDQYIKKGQFGLHIYDDLMVESVSSRALTSMITKKCHHRSVSWILILQNLFYDGKERRTILRCAHYLVVFNNPLDQSVPHALAHKIMPRNQRLFLEIFEKAASKPHGYLLIDGHQHTPYDARLRADIFRGYQKVFIPVLK